MLDLQRSAGNAAVSGLLAQRAAKAKKPATGVAKYGSVRLTDRLTDMMSRGVLGRAGAPETLTREQLHLLQSVANVETGGKDNAVYTRDNMYMSLGFKQVTLGWGSLYDIIEAAPAAFAKHGIVLGGGTYRLKAGIKPAVEGTTAPAELKLPPWTDRFFDAGNEDEVVSAMVWFTLREMGALERRIAKESRGKSSPWMQDPVARAWLLETKNNRPAYSYEAARKTLAQTSGVQLDRNAFMAILEAEIRAAYRARDEGKKADNIIRKIPRDGYAAAAQGGGTRVPAAGRDAPGTELVEPATKALPPTDAGRVGSAAGSLGAAALGAIGALGLTGVAVRLLATAGHRDANALTNLAFWAAHPELFGTKLLTGQSGFAALSAEWLGLNGGLVRDALQTAKSADTAPLADTARPAGGAGGATQAPGPVAAAPGRTPATPGQDPAATKTFVLDGLRSTLELLPEAKRTRFAGIDWGWADYPGTNFPIAAMSPADVARYDSDRALVRNDDNTAFVGRHQSDALALFAALAAVRPGGGERRVNLGDTAMMTKEQFARARDKKAIDDYIVGQIDPSALPGDSAASRRTMNKHAASAFRDMVAAAATDGVDLKVLSAYRSRASEEAGAQQNTNRFAFGGFSPHAMGLAVDVALKVGSAAGGSFSEASTRMDRLVNMLESPAYKWIYMNGATYGFFQYRAEPWHWEYNPDGFQALFWSEAPAEVKAEPFVPTDATAPAGAPSP